MLWRPPTKAMRCGATSGRRLPPAKRWRLRNIADTKVRMKVMSLNIGTMTGKGRELANAMTRRKINIACIGPTRDKVERGKGKGDGRRL